MDNITDIFDSEIQGDLLDQDVTTSAVLLQKLAAEEDIDLDSLPPEDVADLLLKMSGVERVEPIDESTPDQTKEASMSTEIQITNADVALELAKVAAAEEIDLTTIDPVEYAKAFDKLAADMLTPGYAERVEAEKIAAAEDVKSYQTGVKIAEGFIDRVNQETPKVAMDDKDKAPPFAKKDDKDDKDKDDDKDKEAGLAAVVAERAAAEPKVAGDVEEMALKIARQHVLDAGFNPDTGEKLSSEETKVAAAEARALEILKENNWIEG